MSDGRVRRRPAGPVRFARIRRHRGPALVLASVLVGVLTALPAGAAAGTDSSVVDFGNDVLPILRARCVACHLTGQEEGRLALHPKAAHGDLVDVPSVQSDLPRVVPGAPERSYLYLKLLDRHLEAGGEGEPMPLGDWPIEPDELAVIRRWIEQGAAGG